MNKRQARIAQLNKLCNKSVAQALRMLAHDPDIQEYVLGMMENNYPRNVTDAEMDRCTDFVLDRIKQTLLTAARNVVKD